MCCNDKKTASGITVRQCLEKIGSLVENKPQYIKNMRCINYEEVSHDDL
jgi:hypothetical protein